MQTKTIHNHQPQRDAITAAGYYTESQDPSTYWEHVDALCQKINGRPLTGDERKAMTEPDREKVKDWRARHMKHLAEQLWGEHASYLAGLTPDHIACLDRHYYIVDHVVALEREGIYPGLVAPFRERIDELEEGI